MKQHIRVFAATGGLLIAMFAAEPALAQKAGGILKMYSPDSPASMSIHEEATFVAEGPMMGVFNNLVMFDQHAKQNTLGSIVPDLATSYSSRSSPPSRPAKGRASAFRSATTS